MLTCSGSLRKCFLVLCSDWFQIGVALDETVDEKDINDLFYVFGANNSVVSSSDISSLYF